MARLFLSHSSRDVARAAWLRDWLIGQGFEAPFLDFDKHSGIAPGTDWEQVLYHELERSQAVLLLLTPNWQESKWCFAEFTQARALGKPVIPLIEADLPGGSAAVAADVQAVDLRGDRQEGLERLRQQLVEIALSSQGGLPWDSSRPPYPGLPSFEEEDAAIYFGRETEIRLLIERLNARRSLGGVGMLVLLGSSGAGKSSLLRAGVVPRLRRAGHQWIVVPPFRPQRKPLQALALALEQALGGGSAPISLADQLRQALRNGSQQSLLARIANDLRRAAGANEACILLAIDQGEELFLEAEPEERQLLLHLLNAALGQGLPFLAVMTLRSDALASLLEAETLAVRFEQLSLGPMPMERMEEIIVGPARVAGLRVEPVLVRKALRDAATGDALPMLAFALRELHDRSGPNPQLTVSAYEALGDPRLGLSPLENAVRDAAERALADLRPTPAQLLALRDAFVPALVKVNEQGDYARRPAPWSSLPEPALPLLEALVHARVLAVRQERGERLLEVAHEALLRKWPLLCSWLDEARQFLIDAQQLQLAEREWRQAPAAEQEGLLLSGVKLNRARSWLVERPQQLEPQLRNYVEASLAVAERQQRRQKRRRQQILAAMAALSGLSLLAGGLALWQLRQARQAQLQDYAITAFALALEQRNPLQTAIHALASLEDPANVNQRLMGVLGYSMGANAAVGRSALGVGTVWALTALPSGQLVIATDAGLLHWSQAQASERPQAQASAQPQADGQGGVRVLAANAAGEWLSAGRDGTLRRWIGSRPQGPAVASGQQGVVSLVALPGGDAVSGALDGTLRWWRQGQPAGPAQQTKLGAIWALLPLPDGSVLAAGDEGALQRWQARGPLTPPLASDQASVRSLALLPDGSWASGGEDGTIRLWRGQQPRERVGPRMLGSIKYLVALADGSLVGGTDIGNLVLWRGGSRAKSLMIVNQNQLRSLAAGPGGTFWSAHGDGSLASWSWPTPPAWIRETGQGRIASLLVQRDGTLLSGGWDGSIRRWRSLEPLGEPLLTGQGAVRILQQLPNGNWLVGGLQATLQQWRDRQPLGKPISTAKVGLRSLQVLRDGTLISGDFEGKLRRWRGVQPLQPGVATGGGVVLSLAELPGGDLLSGDVNGMVRRLRWPQLLGPAVASGQGRIQGIVPLNDQDWWTAGFDGSLRRWRQGRPSGEPIPVTSPGTPWRLARLPTGEIVVAAEDNYLRSLVAPQLVIHGACQQLRHLPELLQPSSPVERAARRSCDRLAPGALGGGPSPSLALDPQLQP